VKLSGLQIQRIIEFKIENKTKKSNQNQSKSIKIKNTRVKFKSCREKQLL